MISQCSTVPSCGIFGRSHPGTGVVSVCQRRFCRLFFAPLVWSFRGDYLRGRGQRRFCEARSAVRYSRRAQAAPSACERTFTGTPLRLLSSPGGSEILTAEGASASQCPNVVCVYMCMCPCAPLPFFSCTDGSQTRSVR